MIRITAVSGNRSVTYRFEGQLTETSLVQLREADEFRGLGACARLDLSDLQFADQAGAAFLRELIEGGAEVVACSAFVRELLALDWPSRDDGARDAERRFVRRLRAGDEAAFEELVRGYGGRMLSVARRILGSAEDAGDAVQEAFAAAFESICRFNGDAMLATWLHRIVVNAALMQLRRRRRRKPEQSIDELLPHFDSDGSWLDDCRPASITSHAILEERETRELVHRCIGALPETYRVILLLRDIEELDTAETAGRLGIRPATVKVRLHRARQALRTLVERERIVAGDMAMGRRCETRSANAA